jgi:hypothetical protein
MIELALMVGVFGGIVAIIAVLASMD